MKHCVAAVICSLFFMSCRAPYPHVVSLPTDGSVKINSTLMKTDDINAFNQALIGAKLVNEEIYSKPDYVITFKENNTDKILSVFLKEKCIFEGDYLKSWTKRVEGKTSPCIKLSKKVCRILRQYKLPPKK